MSSGSNSAWLIERGQSENHVPTVWWIAGPNNEWRDGEKWTTDASQATKYATRRSAQSIIERLFTTFDGASARATEHVWLEGVCVP